MTRFQRMLYGSALMLMTASGMSLAAAPNTQPHAPVYRDGAHDFDFNFGTWHTHIKMLAHPLTGDRTWTELNGTVTVRKIWDGKAWLEEIEASGPTEHFKGLTLYLYNPQSHQWSQTYVDSSDGVIEPSAIGAFKDGRGELINQQPYNGRIILVRNAWSDIQPNSHRFEISFSDDNGKTWEPNFVADLTRAP